MDVCVCYIFFFKQKTAYEMRISDWSSDVCSSDLAATVLPDLAGQGLLRGQPPAQVLERLRVEPEIEAALAGVHYVQERTPEVLDSMRAVYVELDRLAPREAILASSTSALLPSRFTDHLPGRARCLVALPINTTYLV